MESKSAYEPLAQTDLWQTGHDTEERVLRNKLDRSLICPGWLGGMLSCFCPFLWFGSCRTVRERRERVFMYFGEYIGTVEEPGCFCVNPAGMTDIEISTARQVVHLEDVKVADLKGNPLLLSAVVTYVVVNARRAALDVQSVNLFIRSQGLAVMKRIASLYPYENPTGHSLKGEAERIRQEMITMLQARVDTAGVLVNNFELTDLSYAPEIAQAMLIRQQAEAMVDARRIIVDGAVNISHGALEGLNAKGVQMDPHEQARMVTSLLVTICGEARVQPTINLAQR